VRSRVYSSSDGRWFSRSFGGALNSYQVTHTVATGLQISPRSSIGFGLIAGRPDTSPGSSPIDPSQSGSPPKIGTCGTDTLDSNIAPYVVPTCFAWAQCMMDSWGVSAAQDPCHSNTVRDLSQCCQNIQSIYPETREYGGRVSQCINQVLRRYASCKTTQLLTDHCTTCTEQCIRDSYTSSCGGICSVCESLTGFGAEGVLYGEFMSACLAGSCALLPPPANAACAAACSGGAVTGAAACIGCGACWATTQATCLATCCIN
jgi:hypothetical protein